MSYAGPTAPNRLLPVPLPAKQDAAVFAAGLAIGIAIGAASALLMAPRSGAATRRALARGGRRVSRRSRDVWDDLRETLDSVAAR